MRASRGLGFAVVLLALAGGLRCAYAPNPKSGTLMCSIGTHECPEGYTCDGAFCIKSGETDGGAGGAGGAGGTAGAGVIPCSGSCTIKIGGTLTKMPAGTATTSPEKFVGHWIYDAGSTQTVSCTDGSTMDSDLGGDFVDVAASGGVVTASYFCGWNMTVGPAMSAIVIRAGQSCTRNMTDAKTGTTKFTWHGTTFTLTPKALDVNNTATLASMITVDFVDDASKTGCTPP